KGIAEFSEIKREEGAESIKMADFLSEVSLLTDQDNDKDEFNNKVTLMTVHSAKGLEFKNVFVVGMEEDLFPSQMAKDNPRAIEEERRLFYVAITRAEENCMLTYAKSRFRNGQSTICSPSRFLKDIDAEFLNNPSAPATEDTFAAQRAKYQESALASFRKQSETDDHFTSPVTSEAKQRVARLTKIENATPQTGASAFKGTELLVGSRVRHDRFGEGEVMAIEGTDANQKATVEFDNFGQKQLLLKFAKLTIL
ncbi:MAG: ATP-binding domain-containing protein, partial [Parabacteroides sp.]|nr:ATP-binding domain-containing protein [Parabacteroides sp.]